MNKIAIVKESGNRLQVFNTKGNYMFTRYGKLNNYTESTISIKTPCGRSQVYDSKGNYKFTR